MRAHQSSWLTICTPRARASRSSGWRGARRTLARDQARIDLQIRNTRLLGKVVTASNPAGNYTIQASALYGTLSFVPMLLFVTAVLGVALRKSVEFPFNLSIVSFILLLIVLYFVLLTP